MDTAKVLENEETAEPTEITDDGSKLREKKLLIVIGIILTATAGVMMVSTSVSLSRMQRVIEYHESQNLPVGVAFIAFRMVTVAMIVLALMQLFANMPLTLAVIKEEVDLLQRFNARYAIYTAIVGCLFWLLALSICIYEMQTDTDSGVWLALAVFIGGFLHASLVLYFYMTLETQKRKTVEDTLAAAAEENASADSCAKY